MTLSKSKRGGGKWLTMVYWQSQNGVYSGSHAKPEAPRMPKETRDPDGKMRRDRTTAAAGPSVTSEAVGTSGQSERGRQFGTKSPDLRSPPENAGGSSRARPPEAITA